MSVEPEQSKVDRAYRHLRRLICDMVLPPGTHLQKDRIAADLGVSRAPVSEAITRLAEEMLVDVYPRHGSFVAPIRAADVRECMFIRTALEVEAARRVTALRDRSVVERLNANLARQQEAFDRNDLMQLYSLDQEFHGMLLESLGYPRAARLRMAAGVPLDRPRQFALPAEERAAATLVEHRRIVDGIALGDPDYAAAAMRSHLGPSGRAVEFGLARLAGELTDSADEPQRPQQQRENGGEGSAIIPG
jgi:DNA-binding GntR family transcriptional regulator